MAKKILTNVSVWVDGVDLTQRARSVDIDMSADEVDVTCFGGDGWREFEPGLKAGQIQVTFAQDFDLNSVHATLWPLHESAEAFELRIGPDGDSGATTNPVFVGTVKLFGYKFMQGDVGALSENPVTFRLTGAPTLDLT